jgi:hypothetical protein
MSDVEKFYAASAAKFGSTRTWQQLDPQEQMMFVQGINILLQILTR